MNMPVETGQKPDRWVILRLDDGKKVVRKILSGWQGGYLYGDEWRLSSAIVGQENVDDRNIKATTQSGSSYILHRLSWGLSGLTAAKLEYWQSNKESGVTIEVEEQPEAPNP